MVWRKERADDRLAHDWRILAILCTDGSIRTMIGVYGDNKGRVYDWYVTGNLGGPKASEFEGWCQKRGNKVLAVFDPPEYTKTEREP